MGIILEEHIMIAWAILMFLKVSDSFMKDMIWTSPWFQLQWCFFSILSLVVFEFGIYAIFFIELYIYTNKTARDILTRETRHRRNVANAMTIVGEVYVFITEVCYLLFLVIIVELQKHSEMTQFINEMAQILANADIAIRSTVQLWTSEQLKRELFVTFT